ncbi:ABC transporter permease/substrate-binding protein [Paucilactobacillus suebicus]|uniref:Glycine betaine ABC transporter periplasmic protein n=1 Tax=Paucilactobacillus suebicus DSM 5007 = KCTC 3549 TaxID=1423807 RepID=A0A0R1W328_9LACO|nr:ABC transporter permease/substrate-binding protein [Paucilactobacillus suebicus]KRM12013.1 glycine betaine ABC transporter periplasmic protein [Paucilactobacillus suebicus DSM 5007 = KCTC 3549]
MNSFTSYIAKNGSALIDSLGQHIFISLIAAIIAIIIAVPLAIALINHRRWGEFVLQVTSVIQTIPSLAVLGLLIPLVGIGTVPAIIALVLYAVMPIFQNTYAGLTNIDPLLIEAADAFGMSRRFKLFRVQIPLAMPMILSGIRIAVVMIIGTATLAALIGGGGLGTYIITGIQTNNNNALIAGAVLSALLAILASWLIKVLAKVSFKKLAVGVAILAALVAGGTIYHEATQPKETITIAGKMGGEPEVLINMYKDLIEADNSKVNVVLKPNFGGTSFLFKGLQSGKIDIYPEFTGTVLQSLVKTPKNVSHNPKTSYKLAKKLLNKQYGLDYLKPMKYQNDYALAVRKSDAKKYDLHNLTDLSRVSTEFTAAFDTDFAQQKDGYPGLKKDYGLDFKSVKIMEPTLRYAALANKKVNVTDAYTTDPQVREYHLVTLKDNKSFFPTYQGAPLMTNQFARSHKGIVKSLNKLSGKITTKQMREMNYQVTVKHKKASVVARQFLVKEGLLTK